jgi:phosphatidylglycerophosphatase A
MRDRWVKLIATVFYAGQIPWAPGTWGSLVGLLLFLCVSSSVLAQAIFFSVLTIAGVWSGTHAERLYGCKDPHPVVIDEAAGIFLVFAGLTMTLPTLAVGFILYRLLDILKPFPMRRLEKAPGGWGIMADDLCGGVYAHLALQFLTRLNLLH